MITEKLKELDALKTKTAALEAAIASEQSAALATLPEKYGFTSAAAFIAAVRAASGARRGRPSKKGAKKTKGKPARRRRATITEETRAELKKLVEAGKTGREIAQTLKISLPSVQNIKKALGLVKKAKK